MNKSLTISLKGQDKKTAIRKFLELINVVQLKQESKLSETEIITLINFYLIDNITDKYRFSVIGKKEVRDYAEKDGWNLTPQNINNKIYSLIEKGYLIKKDNDVYAKPWLENAMINLLHAIENNSEYDIKFRFGNDSS